MNQGSYPGFRDTRHALPMALLRSREALMRHFRPMLASHDMTEQQWRVIRVLGEGGPLDATEVGLRAFILGPSLTRIIRLLEDRTLILRSRDSADGRRVMLELSMAGRRLLDEVAPHSRDIYERVETAFGSEKVEALLALLDELALLDFSGEGGDAGGLTANTQE